MGINNIKKAESKRQVIVSVLKIFTLVLITMGIPLYLYFFHRDFISMFKNVDDVVNLLKEYEGESMLIYVGAQMLQVIISIIPGQPFQMAAGYFYGFGIALILSLTGAILGTVISFYLSKLLGRDFLHLFFGEKKMGRYVDMLNSHKGYTLVFFLYLIPGLPKDVVSYAAGVSDVEPSVFLLISTVGRLPGMMGSMLIGYYIDQKNFIAVSVISAIAIIAFILCIVYRKKINKTLDKAYGKIDKLNKKNT